jgi:TRAP-type C4-dicarboxylate transport system substrate-binding protein
MRKSLSFLGLAPLSRGAEAKTIALKAITVFPMDHPVNRDNQAYINEINKRAKGELRIEYLGGPEMVSTFDQAKAVRTGMIDLDLFSPLAIWSPTC